MQHKVYGPQIGTHLGKAIYETIENEDTKLQYVRKANCDIDGCSLEQLAQDEVMLNPGLIYRKIA